MKKALVAAMIALATVLVSVGIAAPAHAYPEPSVAVSISDQILLSGKKFTVTASANVSCAWTATFNGQKRSGVGKDFTATFTAPIVKKKTVFPVKVSCTYADTSAARSNAKEPGTSTVSRTFSITVLPPGSTNGGGSQGGDHSTGPGGLLPGTGGPSAWLLLGGLALLLAGAAALAVARRRARGH